MTKSDSYFNPLLLVLIGVVAFAGGLFFLAILVIILVSLGLLVI